MKEKIFKWSLYPLISICLLSLGACISDTETHEPNSENEDIRFLATIGEALQLETRSNNNVYDLTAEYHDTDYYLYMEGENTSGESRTRFSKYRMPSGAQGTLAPADNTQPVLRWFSREKPHYFWGWTMPCDEGYSLTNDNLSEDIIIEFKGSDINERIYKSLSNYFWDEGSWENGAALEKLLGAVGGPYNYLDNGVYVPIQFRHLVSKILVNTLTLKDNNAGTSTSPYGIITFYGMPTEVTLHTVQKDNGTPMAPYVSIPENWDYNQESEVPYVITNTIQNYLWEGHEPTSSTDYSCRARDCWYIPPELDFSKLSFKIEFYEYNTSTKAWSLSTSHGNHGAFYGDFSNVVFTRSSNGTNYDNYPKGGDETILHAGEYLTLTLNLYENGNPVIRGSIGSWSLNSSSGTQHYQQGIYSLNDMKNFQDIMKSGSDAEKEEFFDMFGSGRTTEKDSDEYPEYDPEKKIFELFDDIGVNNAYDASNSTNKISSPLNIDSDYILDGRGHTINVNGNGVNFITGAIRDVYLRTCYGTKTTTEYIVYIDKQGYVWIVDPVTYEETPSLDPEGKQYNVNIPGQDTVTISIKNGVVS